MYTRVYQTLLFRCSEADVGVGIQLRHVDHQEYNADVIPKVSAFGLLPAERYREKFGKEAREIFGMDFL